MTSGALSSNQRGIARELYDAIDAFKADNMQWQRVVSAISRAAQLEADKRRLDYVESHFHVLGFTRGDTWFRLQPYGEKPKRYSSIREAIDDMKWVFEPERPTDETTVATTGGPVCAHPVGNYRCPTCGIEVTT